MEQITAFNNLAVRLLLEGPSRFYEAEQILRNAMTLLNQQGDEQPTAMSSNSSNNNTASAERLSNRRGRDSISRRSSSSSSSSSCTAAAVCSRITADVLDDDDDDDEMRDDYDETLGDDDDDSLLETMAVKSLPLAYADTTASSSPLPAQVHLSLPLFNRALAVSNTAEPEEIAATVLYNLGLIRHMRGLFHLSHPLRPHDSIHRALRLYDYAIRILQQRSHHQQHQHQNMSAAPQSSTPDDLMVDELLVLALFYNIGHVQSHLFAFDKAGIYFDFLRHVLDDSSSSNIGGGTIALHDDDHSFFFLNAMLFQGEQLPLAPAA